MIGTGIPVTYGVLTESGLPNPILLSNDETEEFHKLVGIVQNVSGIKHIASNGLVYGDLMCTELLDRLRHLLMKERSLRDERDAKGRTSAD